MKRLLNNLFAGIGAFTLAAVFAPAEASAQQCRSGYNSHTTYRSYGHGHGYTTRSHYRAPRRYTSTRIVTHPHYGGPIYYRNTNRSCYTSRPSVRVYRAPRYTRSAPTYRRCYRR